VRRIAPPATIARRPHAGAAASPVTEIGIAAGNVSVAAAAVRATSAPADGRPGPTAASRGLRTGTGASPDHAEVLQCA
jgi:hypothetical protein